MIEQEPSEIDTSESEASANQQVDSIADDQVELDMAVQEVNKDVEDQSNQEVVETELIDAKLIDEDSELTEINDPAKNSNSSPSEVVSPQLGLLGTDTHSQEEMHFAVVDGQPINDVPKDLYIPPDALEVFLEAFEIVIIFLQKKF
jgi:segregation and condensation protein A